MGIFGPCAQAILESSYVSAISRCVKRFQRRKFRWGASRRIRTEESGLALATEDLVLFRDGVQEKFRLDLLRQSGHQSPIVQADGSVLAAFDDGLVGLRQGKAQRMTTKNGLPCNAVYSFIEDKEKRWWLSPSVASSSCRIPSCSGGGPTQKPSCKPDSMTHWTERDQAHTYFNSAACSPDGRVWFANGLVVQMVDPSRLSQKALPAPTYIESVIVDRKEFAASENLKLAPHPRDLQIDYTSPTFTIPQKVKFRYRLDSYDHDWHDAGTRRQAFYTDLPPGKYSLSRDRS